MATLEETIANLAHENAILKRRLFGNKTERSHTSEAQLAFGDLLAAEERLQKEFDDAVAKAKEGAGVAEQEPGTPGERKKPKGHPFASNSSSRISTRQRGRLLASKLRRPANRVRGQRAVDVPSWRVRRAGQASGALRSRQGW